MPQATASGQKKTLFHRYFTRHVWNTYEIIGFLHSGSSSSSSSSSSSGGSSSSSSSRSRSSSSSSNRSTIITTTTTTTNIVKNLPPLVSQSEQNIT